MQFRGKKKHNTFKKEIHSIKWDFKSYSSGAQHKLGSSHVHICFLLVLFTLHTSRIVGGSLLNQKRAVVCGSSMHTHVLPWVIATEDTSMCSNLTSTLLDSWLPSLLLKFHV